MATAPFTIRNVSSTPLEIKLVERYVPTVEKSPFVSLVKTTKEFTRVKLNATATPSIPDTATPSAAQEVSIRIEPFQTVVTEINGPNPSIHESVRLTFEIEGERHQVDTPSPSNASTVSKPLTDNPHFGYTAIYLPQYAHLTFFSSANPSSWMSRFKDVTPLSALSIPGTHNSPTHHHALPSVQCQAVSVPEQLDNGVRFLDIRVQPEDADDTSKDGLVLVHGQFPISLRGKRYFRDLVNHVLAFLDAHPSETVIMSVKREGPGDHTDAQLARRLRDHYASDPARWYTAPGIPTLGEARRKIVLMRRFALDDALRDEYAPQGGWCINAETWQYNTPSDVCPSGDVCVQDFCEVMETKNIEVKVQYCEAQLDRSAINVTCIPGGLNVQADQQQQQSEPPPKQPLYINFLSGSNFWNVQTWPERIATKVNPAIVDYLCRRHGEAQGKEGDWSTGIVVCDWVGKKGDWDLIRCIVGMNAKLEYKMNAGG